MRRSPMAIAYRWKDAPSQFQTVDIQKFDYKKNEWTIYLVNPEDAEALATFENDIDMGTVVYQKHDYRMFYVRAA